MWIGNGACFTGPGGRIVCPGCSILEPQLAAQTDCPRICPVLLVPPCTPFDMPFFCTPHSRMSSGGRQHDGSVQTISGIFGMAVFYALGYVPSFFSFAD